MTEIPYLLRGVMPVSTDSSVLVSSSKYLNDPRLREWLAMILLRRNGTDVPAPAEIHDLLPILHGLRDFDAIEDMFTEERKVNPEMDAWFSEGFISDHTVEDFAHYAPGTLGGIFYRQMTAGDYPVQIVPWKQPRTQFEYYNLRSAQTHDFEHILCGGRFDFMGELVPYWYRLTNVPRHMRNPELAAEVNVIQIFGSLRYTVRTMLHYPQVWPTCVNAIQRGMAVGQQSDALFMKKLEPAFHLPLAEAREALGVRGAVDTDTSREGAFWGSDGRIPLEPPVAEAAE